LVRKSGKTFEQVMGHMKDLGLQDLAKVYKDMSDKVMEHELNRYVPIFGAPPPAISTLMPMPTPTPSGLGFSDTSLGFSDTSLGFSDTSLGFFDTSLAMDVDSQDEDFSEPSGTDGPTDSVLEKDGDGFLQFL
jgi:hypothetical protein